MVNLLSLTRGSQNQNYFMILRQSSMMIYLSLGEPLAETASARKRALNVFNNLIIHSLQNSF